MSITNNDVKRVVPWVSMGEWKKVYQMIYSEDYNQKLKGLNHMMTWRSRVPKLILGVECSLHLVQAILRDQMFQECDDGTLTENDLALLYSTAIIRFINLMSHLGQVERHQPISAIAEMAGIPDWLVSIRHEATHAKMPSLGILRPGAKLAMEWLEENYWRAEEEDSLDLYWPDSKKQKARRLQEKINKTDATNSIEEIPKKQQYQHEIIPEELYRAVSMLVILLNESVDGHNWLNQLSSKPVRRYGCELWFANKATTTSIPMSQKMSDKCNLPITKLSILMVTEIEKVASQWAESVAAESVIDTSKEETMVYKGQCLVSALCQCPELLTGYKSGKILEYLPLLKLVNSWQSFPMLMEKLSEIILINKHEKEQEALLHLLSDLAGILLSARDLPVKSVREITFAKSIFSFNWMPTIRILLQEPLPGTWAVVSKLFTLMESTVTAETREKVAELLSVYLDDKNIPKQRTQLTTGSSKVYTLDMLQPTSQTQISIAKTSVNQPSKPMNLPPVTSVSIDSWTPCAEFNWSKIPIGILPGNNSLEPDALELTVEWQRIEAEADPEDDYQIHGSKRKRTGNRFDWNSLMLKRGRRRGGVPKDAPANI